MGPNNGENQSGGVTTLEPQATVPAAPEAGNGLLPTPGASAPEASTMPAMNESAAPSTPEASATPGMPDLGTSTTPTSETSTALNPMAPLKTPDVSSLQATHNTMVAEKAAAQAAPQKPGLGNRILGLIGLRGSAKVETVQPTNTIPDHLKNGVTPPVPNVTPEAAAAVNQEPVKPSSSEMDAAIKQGIMEDKANLEPAHDAANPATNEPTPVVSADATSAGSETPDPTATSAVTEAESIVKNATDTNAALDEIDKTANDAMNSNPSETKPDNDTTAGTTVSEPFPSYGVQTEGSVSENTTEPAADATQNATPDTPLATESPSAWPASPAAEPTTSGPSEVVEPIATPQIPEYKPTSDMAPAGESAAPTTPTNWSVDASAAHPDAPIVGNVPPAPEAPSSIPSPEPNSLNLESTATPLQGAASETPQPFGTGIPPSVGESATSADTTPVETPTPSPTIPEPPAESALGPASTTPTAEPPSMDILGQAGQVPTAAETTGGVPPTTGASSPTVEDTSSSMPTAEVNTTTTGSVTEQAAAAAGDAEVPSLGTAQTETPAAPEPTLAGVGATAEPTETTENGTGTPPLATS